MPLTVEGKIMVAYRERESDRRLQEKYGLEKLKEKLDQEGVYAYGFSDEPTRRNADRLLFRLSEDYQYGDVNLREKYFNHVRRSRWFDFEYWYSEVPESREVLVVRKPFPNEDYEHRLILNAISFKKVPVYRFAELTDEEIRYRLRNGVWHNPAGCWIDLNEHLTNWRKKIALRGD